VVVVPSELGSVMAQVAQGIEAQERSPQFPYHNRVRAVNYGDCYFFQPITLEQLGQVGLWGAVCVGWEGQGLHMLPLSTSTTHSAADEPVCRTRVLCLAAALPG
jgi:hypothetical protein